MEEQRLLKRKTKAAGNRAALVSACTDLASYYASMGQFSRAIEEYKVLCRIYEEEKQMLFFAQANRGLGEAYMGLHEFQKTLQCFKTYYAVSVQEGNVLEQQRALAQLGHLYLTWYLETINESNRKLLDEAYGYLMRSMKKCESLSDSVEKQDIIARLFSNLGLVKENLGDYDTSFQLYEKSIKICLSHDLYEQLYRGYLSMASLLEKQEKYQETVKNYNLAVEAAKKLSSNRVELICAALLFKSETLIKIADFQGAKQVLRKAYKFKTPNEQERKVIERHLRVVAGMCKVEDDIITCNTQKELKRLYEQMGDGACDLKIYSKAVEYYKKMLEAAEKSGASDKDLGECYFSLAKTYKDNGKFPEAEYYFEKEYNICKGSLKDSLNTLCEIADLKEIANEGVDCIKRLYERALASCRKKQSLVEERRILVRYKDFLRRFLCNKEAFNLEKQLQALDDKIGDDLAESSSSDCESEDSAKVHIGDDIVLSDITDQSEQSDDDVPETEAAQPLKRRRQNAVKFKRNLNGEWPLHVACIKGNGKMVQYWLDVDHPVNVRDNAGWLPLHEAAVHGYIEIVRLLLDHKASINDRGGSECNGITPLHDAASNGHLEVIELLLDRGASAVAKTDDGNTPLFELKKWFKRNGEDLSGDQLSFYHSLTRRLEDALDKAGQKDTEIQSSSPNRENYSANVSRTVGSLRRTLPMDDYEEEQEAPDASNQYQAVMQTLRHKNYSMAQPSPASTKRAALVSEEDFVDPESWLEADVRPAKNKRRKTEELWGRNRSFGECSISNNSPQRAEEDLLTVCEDDFLEAPSRRDSTGSADSRNSSRRRQVTLLDSGFSKQRQGLKAAPRQSLSLKRASSEHTVRTSQARITNYAAESRFVAEADSTTRPKTPFPVLESTQPVADPMLFADVEIEGKVFRVPIRMSQVQSKTIKWLAAEAALRYESKEFMKPVLELETVDGVILGENDLLSLLFPMGSVQAERIVGKVTEWSLASVLERYKETCSNMGVEANHELCDLIATLSVSLDISDRGVLGGELGPLLKSLNNQKALTQINLSGNFLNGHAVSLFCSSLGTLSNLEALNLSCTGLQRGHLSQLASAVSCNSALLAKLTKLDLSDNIALQNACFKDLSVISNSVNLKQLNLSNTGLTGQLPADDTLCLKTVEELDVSFNQLTDSDLRIMLGWLDMRVLRALNVSRNHTERALRQLLEESAPGLPTLEKIDFEGSGVDDSDLFELLRLAPNITCVNLAYNPDLTSISLRRLLEHGSVSFVNLQYCDSMWAYFDVSAKGWDIAVANKAIFKIPSGPQNSQNCLIAMFGEKYERFLHVDVSYHGFTVVVNDVR